MLSCGVRAARRIIIPIATLALWAGVPAGRMGQARASETSSNATYAGAAACAKCHPSEQKKWAGARHSRMVQPATRLSVQGDFSRGLITLRGSPYTLSARAGVYYITETYLSGQPRE